MNKIVRVLFLSMALMVGTAHAQNPVVNYGSYGFSLPESWGVLFADSDCTVTVPYVISVDEHYCNLGMPIKTYLSADYEKSLYILPGSALRNMSEALVEDLQELEPANFTNFIKLLRGDVAIEDFYDDGLLIDDGHRVFDLIPMMMLGNGMSMIRDITPVEVNEQLVGYAFTPAIAGGDWPPVYTFRMTIVYMEKYDLLVALQEQLPLPMEVDSIYQYLEKHGQKDASGEIDYAYYEDQRKMLDILNEHFDAVYLETMPTYPEGFHEDIQELFLPGVPPFSDVPATDLLADAVSYTKYIGAVGGYPDGTFRPKALINRAEFMKLLLGSLSDDQLRQYEKQRCFSDVDPDAWYAKYVCAGKATNLVSGYPDGTFGVEKNINLAEALKILLGTMRLADATRVIPQYTSDWYSGYLETAKLNGLLRRIRINPAVNITRAEMAELIYKLDGMFERYYIPSPQDFEDLIPKG